MLNYHLSWARRVIENAFRIIAAQRRIHHRVIGVRPVNLYAIVKATVALHNSHVWNSMPETPVPLEEENITALQHVRRAGTNNSTLEAIAVREAFNSFFSATGKVPWQYNIA
eukprot:superscaffoldBa00001307_g9999